MENQYINGYKCLHCKKTWASLNNIAFKTCSCKTGYVCKRCFYDKNLESCPECNEILKE